MLTIGSLFSGIGGLELGLERAGLGPVIWQAESDEYATKVLEKHWPNVHRFRDVRDIDERAERPDIICGGFPCQDISSAGKKAGLAGESSSLWWEFARILRQLRPMLVVVENVASLLDRGMGDVLGELASLGYDAEWDCIPAAAVGAPHKRDRAFILAYPNVTLGDVWNGYGLCEDDARTSRQRLSIIPRRHYNDAREHPPGRSHKDANPISEMGHFGRSKLGGRSDYQKGRRLRKHEIRGVASNHMRSSSSQETPGMEDRAAGRVDCEAWKELLGPDPWIIEPDVGRVAHGVPARVDRLRCLGNAVVPQVAEVVGRRIIDVLQLDAQPRTDSHA